MGNRPRLMGISIFAPSPQPSPPVGERELPASDTRASLPILDHAGELLRWWSLLAATWDEELAVDEDHRDARQVADGQRLERARPVRPPDVPHEHQVRGIARPDEPSSE